MTNTEGGVATYMRTFLKFRKNRELFIKLVLVSNSDESLRVVENDFEADEIVNFVYNKYENVFYILKRLSTCIESPDDIILANERMELTMVNLFKMSNKVFNIIHGDSSYYYENVSQYWGIVDGFISASEFIYKKASSILKQHTFEGQIRKIFAPVRNISPGEKELDKICRIIYVGRVDAAKGAQHIVGICTEMDILRIPYNLTIVGMGNLIEDIEIKSRNLKGKIIFAGFISNEEVINLLKLNEILLFPSYTEAVGLAVVEAMKAGVVPVTSDLESGIPEIVIEDLTGYKVKIGWEYGFAQRISYLFHHPNVLMRMHHEGIRLSNELFDPIRQVKEIESFIDKIRLTNISKRFGEIRYGFRLDSKFIPNRVTILFRRIIAQILSRKFNCSKWR